MALAFASAHPGAWLKLQLRKTVLLWTPQRILDTESQETYAEWSRATARARRGRALWCPRTAGALRSAVVVAGSRAPRASGGDGRCLRRERRHVLHLRAVPVPACADPVALRRDRTDSAADVRRSFIPKQGAEEGPAEAGPYDRLRQAFGGLPQHRIAVVVAVVASIVFTNWSIVSADMNRTVTEHNLGAALQSEGRLDEAMASYRRALAITPDYAPAIQQHRHGFSRRRAMPTWQSPPINTRSHSGPLPRGSVQPRECAAQREQAERGRRSLPSCSPGHSGFGRRPQQPWDRARRRRQADEAIAEFELAVRFDPTSAKAHRNLGDALASADRGEEGLSHLRRAVELDPRDLSAHYDLASVLLEQHRIPEAIAEFRAAISIDPSSVDAHNNLGNRLTTKHAVMRAHDALGAAGQHAGNLPDQLLGRFLQMPRQQRHQGLRKIAPGKVIDAAIALGLPMMATTSARLYLCRA